MKTEELLALFKNPEFVSMTDEFGVKLTNESERGAILIGCGLVEEYLGALIRTILPSKTKNYENKLFKYPGPLSSFSGKIELSYAFRLIDKNLYNSLNTLRKIRNEAAHSSENFSLKGFENELETIFKIDENNPDFIHNLSHSSLINHKLQDLNKDIEKSGLDVTEVHERFFEKLKEPEIQEIIEKQLLTWKLFYGLAFLSFDLKSIRKKYEEIISLNKPWINILNKST